MRILFAIALLAFAAMVVASVMIVRHIRKTRQNHRPASHNGGSSAADRAAQDAFSTPEPSSGAEKTNHENSSPRFPLSSQRLNGWSESAMTELSVQASSVPPSKIRTTAAPQLHPELAYYNKEMGDLSDPRPAGRYKTRGRNQ